MQQDDHMEQSEGLQQPTDPAALLRLPDVLRLVPVARSTWWQGVRDGRFPKPVKVGPRITAWKRSDVLKLIERLTSKAA